ncbi:MAG: NFACT RNA binding domain-containing protein [Candidatus Eisenbacteria bacterium]
MSDTPDNTPPRPADNAADPAVDRSDLLRKALKRYVDKLGRKLNALHTDLAEAERGPEYRRFGETLLAYAHLVPARAAQVTLADASDPDRMLDIALDPYVSAPANAARYFKRAAKCERGLRDTPPRIAALDAEIQQLRAQLEAHAAPVATPEEREAAELLLEQALFALSFTVREQIKAPQPLPRKQLGLAPEPERRGPQPTSAAPKLRGKQPEVLGKLVPWRYRTQEGWDVLIGRSSDGNDHLTLHMARPEDYWFHAHGCPGSHVVLRRGKGPNEPSKSTLEEVAAWAAFHSKARSAGKVPVNYTQKKYVRKPRGAKAGLVYIERERTVMVRPIEPPKDRMADAANENSADE